MRVVAIAPRGDGGALTVLIDRLEQAGAPVTVLDDLPSAAEIARETPAEPPVVLVDLRHVSKDSDVEDIKLATETIRRTVKELSHVKPVAITGEADPMLILACIRAGAGDVIDLQLEGTGMAPQIVRRIDQRQRERAADALAATALRETIEELMKELVRTERERIDLEEAPRGPAILILDPLPPLADPLAFRLEVEDVTTFVFSDTDEALRAAGAVDLAVVLTLPDDDGASRLQRLAERQPDLLAFPMAMEDAELPGVVPRLAQRARETLQHTREQMYLQRIKERHERVLARYRALPRES